MKIITHTDLVFGKQCRMELMTFDKSDRKEWKRLFDLWVNLKYAMREYKAREPNFPEGLSEVAFCLYSGSNRLISLKGPSSASFDTFNTKTHKAEQIKASSVERDLSSFGPSSKWDDIYFMDFYNEGKLDGTFNLYLIPNENIYSMNVNTSEVFMDQQSAKRRPRFSIIDSVIKATELVPIERDIKVW